MISSSLINNFMKPNFSILKKLNSWNCCKAAIAINTSRCLYTSNYRLNFHEVDPKIKDDLSVYQHLRSGLFMLKDEVKMWQNEVQESFETDALAIVPGAVDVVFSFDKKEKLDNWVVTSDKESHAGHSSCEFFFTEDRKGVFQGILCTEVPKDGLVTKSGFCNIKSIKNRKSFKREEHFDWSPYTHLVFRVRGDGRSFLINLHTPGYYDLMWNDMYQYVLFTRGGPYWQTSKIPFSKFFLSSKGKVQDLQDRVPLDTISNVGITLADKNNGPFKLEIDYIGLEYDPNFTEEFAYEMYQLPKGMANS